MKTKINRGKRGDREWEKKFYFLRAFASPREMVIC